MVNKRVSIQAAIGVLNAGGIIAYPTEACFGLGCLINNEQGIARIRQLKQRPETQGIIVVTDEIYRLNDCINTTNLSESTLNKISESWPGAVTWLLPVLENCPQSLIGDHDTLAVRIPDFAPIRALCTGVQSAITSTSANLKGRPPLKTAQAIQMDFADKLDAIVDLPIQGRASPSQIIDAESLQTIRPA